MAKNETWERSDTYKLIGVVLVVLVVSSNRLDNLLFPANGKEVEVDSETNVDVGYESASIMRAEPQDDMSRYDFLNECNAVFVTAAGTGFYAETGKSAEDFFFDYVLKIKKQASSEGIELSSNKLIKEYSSLIAVNDTDEIDKVWQTCKSYVEDS